MPIISNFYGIVISMYNNGEHNPPHFHASYQGYNASFYLDGRLKEGSMPKTQRKHIAEWAELHKEELLNNWELAINEKPLFKIEPLR